VTVLPDEDVMVLVAFNVYSPLSLLETDDRKKYCPVPTTVPALDQTKLLAVAAGLESTDIVKLTNDPSVTVTVPLTTGLTNDVGCRRGASASNKENVKHN
jgi:hypothetical protein